VSQNRRIAPRHRAAFWHTENPFMFRWTFRPRPRHPLLRLLAAVVGLAALLVLLAFGLFAAVAIAIGGALVLFANALRSSRGADAPPAAASPAGVIEGEFKVVQEPRRPTVRER
jgi:hypothetical protein